jgi:hypothetical protein
MDTSVNITKRVRKRKLTTGAMVKQTRWVLNYREPRSGRSRQLFFDKHKDAQARRNQIIAEVETGTYSEDRARNVTIRETSLAGEPSHRFSWAQRSKGRGIPSRASIRRAPRLFRYWATSRFKT